MTGFEERQLNQLQKEIKLSQNIIKAGQERYAESLVNGLGDHIKEKLSHQPTRWERFRLKVKNFFAWLS